MTSRLLSTTVPPIHERPIWINHPCSLLAVVLTVSAIVGMTIAIESDICGDNGDYAPPNSNERWRQTGCRYGLSFFAPIAITLATAATIQIARTRFAQRFGVRPNDLVVESGGD